MAASVIRTMMMRRRIGEILGTDDDDDDTESDESEDEAGE